MGNLLDFNLIVRFNMPLEEQPLTKAECFNLFQAVSNMHIVSPWKEKDVYWASFGGRLIVN